MARDETIIQGAVTDKVIQPTWGTMDGSEDGSGGVSMDQILANVASMLGTMAFVDDAPADNKQYARKNGTWSSLSDE